MSVVQTAVAAPGTAQTQTISATFPGALTPGTLLVAVHFTRTAAPAAPAGFDLLSRIANSVGSPTIALSFYGRRVVGGDSTTVTVDLGASALSYQNLVVYELDEIVGATPADCLDSAWGGGTDSTLNVSTIDTGRSKLTNAPGAFSIAAAALQGDGGTFGAWTGGFTQRATHKSTGGTASSAATLTVADAVSADLAEVRGAVSWPTARRAYTRAIALRTQAPVALPVDYAWVGATTATSAVVSVRTAADASVRLAVSTSPALTSPTYTAAVATSAAGDRCAKLTATGLTARTNYYYGVEINGTVDPHTIGRFRTAPTPGSAASFTLAISGCTNPTGGAHPVFDAIRDADPDLMLHLGDLHYDDHVTADESLYLDSFKTVLTSDKQAGFFRNVPTAYVWDDHDAPGGENADKIGPGITEGRAAYRKVVPHYPQPTSTGAIHQAITWGRVRVLLLDLRSERDPVTDPAGPGKSTLGVDQKAWLKAQVDEVAADTNIKLLVIDTGVPWIATAGLNGSDNWLNYEDERAEVANYIVDAGLTDRVLMIASDMHGLAADTGTNNTYADGGAALWPVFQCGSLLSTSPSVKGGPYDLGEFGTPNSYGQFGLLTVTDTGGDTINVDFLGQRVAGALSVSTMVAHSFAAGVVGSTPAAAVVRFGGAQRNASLYVNGVARSFTVQAPA